ncbi:MAG: DUF655 domain-containing protein [Gemmataceae bacterium]
MADTEKGLPHAPARWVLIVLVTGLTSLVLGNELRFQFGKLTRKRDLASWKDLKQQKWDPNTATLAELELVPGLGPKLAQSILEARKTKFFRCLEDLGKIKGFGPQRLGLMGTWLQFPEESTGSPPQSMALTGQGAIENPEAKPVSFKRLDPNLATAEELETIPGIGPKMASKIITERQIKKYESIEDLVRVNGIGPKNIEKLRPFLTVAP